MRKTKECRRCGTSLSKNGYCRDETCPFSDYDQDDARGFEDHEDREDILERFERDGVVWKNK